jgi:hypothetical protein
VFTTYVEAEQVKTLPIYCSAGCKRTVTDEEAATVAGWEQLSITMRWRCGACGRELAAASSIVGMVDAPFVDALPADSRGALPRETASSIMAAAVRP